MKRTLLVTTKVFYTTLFAVLSLSQFFSQNSFASKPDPVKTPGVLCTAHDPDFSGFVYPDHVARCARNITNDEKARIAQEYGLPQSSWDKVEFDHLLPLCAGGSNDIGNLWPQPLAEAHEKDLVEDQVCRAMRAGNMTQQKAVQVIRSWIKAH